MIRRKKEPPKNGRFIVEQTPLITKKGVDDLDNPVFLEKVRNKHFEELEKTERIKSPIFKTDFMRQVYYLCKNGLTDARIAEFFGVNISTVREWNKANPEFLEAKIMGRQIFNLHVTEALGARALGYNYTESEVAEHLDRNGDVHTLTKTMHKHIPPDLTAIIFWLKNRDKENWADISMKEVREEKITRVDLTNFDPEEQKVLKKLMIKRLAEQHGNTE